MLFYSILISRDLPNVTNGFDDVLTGVPTNIPKMCPGGTTCYFRYLCGFFYVL
jgi:hypothetical protein